MSLRRTFVDQLRQMMEPEREDPLVYSFRISLAALCASLSAIAFIVFVFAPLSPGTVVAAILGGLGVIASAMSMITSDVPASRRRVLVALVLTILAAVALLASR